MADKQMYFLKDSTQNYSFSRLKLVVETLNTTQLNHQPLSVRFFLSRFDEFQDDCSSCQSEGTEESCQGCQEKERGGI